MGSISAQNRAKVSKNSAKTNENSEKLLKTAKRQKTMQLLITKTFTSKLPAEGEIKTNPIQTQFYPGLDPGPQHPGTKPTCTYSPETIYRQSQEKMQNKPNCQYRQPLSCTYPLLIHPYTHQRIYPHKVRKQTQYHIRQDSKYAQNDRFPYTPAPTYTPFYVFTISHAQIAQNKPNSPKPQTDTTIAHINDYIKRPRAAE